MERLALFTLVAKSVGSGSNGGTAALHSGLHTQACTLQYWSTTSAAVMLSLRLNSKKWY